jgi:hypothetical protein
MLKAEIEKENQCKRNIKKERCQPRLTFHIRYLDHEIMITT